MKNIKSVFKSLISLDINKTSLFLFLILIVGFIFRFNNLNWDANYHLHPDERFLTMVGTAMKIPSGIFNYFDPKISTLNPANIGFNFFVYGVFPVTVNKIIAVIFNNDNYNAFTVQGRFLSAFVDLLIIFLVYKTAILLIGKAKKLPYPQKLPLLAAFLYAIAVLPIQLSHFFATDTFLNFFMFVSFYFALKFSMKDSNSGSLKYILVSGFFFGLALACKITALFIVPLNLYFIASSIFPGHFRNLSKENIFKVCKFIVMYLLTAYFVLRLADPYMFNSINIFDIMPNKAFIDSLKSLKALENKDAWYPPGVQWINKTPVLFSLINLVVFGVGLPYFIFICLGGFWIVFETKYLFSKKFQISNFNLQIILLWTLIFFLYQSTQYAQTIRYYIIIYPFLAIFAAIGIVKVISNLKLIIKKIVTHKTYFNVACFMLYILCFIFLFIWPLMFSSVYIEKMSRIKASEWIYQNIPNGSFILTEHWDDGLPIPMENNYGKQFFGDQLPVFGADTPEKWLQMNQLLDKGDYYILSSNRGWGSIPTVPKRYPKMTKFYQDLFAGKLNYKKIAEFTSYPSLRYLGIPIDFPDQWSDESFTVYDHPKVMIFKKINQK